MPRIVNPFAGCCRAPQEITAIKEEKTKQASFESVLQAGKIDQLRTLIQHKDFNPNAALKNGAYPLHLAIHKAAPDTIIDALLRKGANPFIEDGCGLTATDHAILTGNKAKLEQVMGHFVTFDKVAAQDVINELPKTAEKVKKAIGALEKAVSILEINQERLPEISRNLLKGKWDPESPRETISKPDCYGMLPLHYAIQLYSTASESDKQVYEEIIKDLISKTEDLTVKTAASLTLAHFAIIAKCPDALNALLEKEKKLLQIHTLTDLSPLHIAFLQGDYASAKIILEKAPELLTKPDQNGLTPLQIFVHAIFQHGQGAVQKTAPIQLQELKLFAMHCLLPIVNMSYEQYCPASIAKYVPLALLTILYAAEYEQSGTEAFPAYLQGGLEASFAPTGITGFIFKTKRVGPVAMKSFTEAQKSWNYSSYSPLTALKNGVVHITIGALSAGRELYSWFTAPTAAIQNVGNITETVVFNTTL
jgi:ankyrin repeat protein